MTIQQKGTPIAVAWNQNSSCRSMRHFSSTQTNLRFGISRSERTPFARSTSFPELAEALDNLQEHYQVSFVISAGNYDYAAASGFPARRRAGAGRKDHHARRQRPRDHRGRGGARRLQEQRAEKASPGRFLSARRGAELCNQAGPGSLRWIMFHGPCAYCRYSFGERDAFGRESRDEFCNAVGGPHSRADLSPGHAHAVSRTGESATHAPCARSANVVARAGRRRKLLRLRAACTGAILPGMLASHVHAWFSTTCCDRVTSSNGMTSRIRPR